MFGLQYETPKTTDKAASIWHKLIPGAAITLQISLESFLSATYGSETCSGRVESIFRTVAFFLSWIVGLRGMKWGKSFSYHRRLRLSAKRINFRRLKHSLVNIGVVTGWSFAVSDFPLKCWMEGEGSDKTIGAIRGFLVVLVHAFVSLEVFDVDIVDNHKVEDQEGVVVNERSGLAP